MNQNLYHYFVKGIFRLIRLLSSRGSVCLFSHVKNCWHLLNFILCQFFHALSNSKHRSFKWQQSHLNGVSVNKCHIFFGNSIMLMTNFILLTTCHLMKYLVFYLNLWLSFIQWIFTESAMGQPLLGPGLTAGCQPSRRPQCCLWKPLLPSSCSAFQQMWEVNEHWYHHLANWI